MNFLIALEEKSGVDTIIKSCQNPGQLPEERKGTSQVSYIASMCIPHFCFSLLFSRLPSEMEVEMQEKKLGNDLSSHAWKRPFMITAASDHLSALTAVETFDSLFLHRVHCANTNKDAQLSVPEQLCFLSV